MIKRPPLQKRCPDGDLDRNPSVLKKLARETGGEYYLPEKVNKIAAICAHIAADLRSQYTISYAPSDERHDGRYRRVEVIATAPGRGRLAVRTRPGYYAPRASGPADAGGSRL